MRMLLVLSAFAGLAFGQAGNRAAVLTTGQFEPDGNVVYNVYVAAGQEDLEQLTISAALPAGVRFLESVHSPLEGRYDGVKSDTISWKAEKLERDTLLGPLSFRVKLDGTAVDLPATIRAAVSYARPVAELVESPAPSGKLAPLAQRGSVTFDQRGTLDATGKNTAVTVGDTGVVLYIPEGAVSERVTITFNRLNVADHNLPFLDPAYWWCSLYQISVEPQMRFSKEIAIAYPSRRGLTPGTPTSMFVSEDLVNWSQPAGPPAAIAKADSTRSLGFGQQAQNVNIVCVSQFGFTTCRVIPTGGLASGFGGFGAFGYVEQDNLRGKVTSTSLGTTAIQTVTNPPSIIAILIGARP